MLAPQRSAALFHVRTHTVTANWIATLLEIPVKDDVRAYLDGKQLSALTGQYSPDLYVRVPLAFVPIEELASALEGFSQLEDWLYDEVEGADDENLLWPADFVPIAVMQPVSAADEEIYANANGSATEEFYAINQNEDGYPVYCWNHDVGFERRFETLEAFLANLVVERPD